MANGSSIRARTNGQPAIEADGFDSGDGGGHDGRMEARIARLESDIEYIKRDVGELKTDVKELRKEHHSDFRILFGTIIASTLGLGGLMLGLGGIMARGFKWF